MTLDIRQHITANDIATADSIKGELPSVTFSARFTGGRRYDKLSEYNGEIVLDLDKKSPEELARISKAVTGNPHTHISFTSPKGNGYKLTTITSLPDGTLPQSSEEVRNYHAHAYDQVAALYEELCQTDIDESGKDMTRICYLPHDENVYLNPNPQVLIVDLNRPLREKKKKTLLKDPAESGIDWNAPLYVFEAPTLHNTAITLKIADLEKFEAMLRLLAQEQLCTAPVEAGGYWSVEIKDAGVLLAYNDGTLLGVYGGSTEQLKKLQPAITALMQQPADKSIRTGKYFAPMMQQKGDIRLLATPDALPMDVRGVLTWPHGTQLLGYVLFENGRIYATLQNADFKGNTKESNQPFHPQNSRELQQAMLNMMHGRAFNISLTSNELLTLSNLRVLMEYAPDEPEVSILYQLIMKIEELNLRGDKNRTNFTVVLNEKNENALKQLTDFAKLFIGM